ncbi:MAG: hypothetical protein HOV81_08345 [Kofleriaceae bacterium]|nr:hypothetical protein [Kofleriaceae bacterium]
MKTCTLMSLLLLHVLACSSESEVTPTSSLHLSAWATGSDRGRIDVLVYLDNVSAPPGDHHALESGDSLAATLRGSAKELMWFNPSFAASYFSVSFNVQAMQGDRVGVELHRETDVDAVGSYAEIPAPLVVSPIPATVSRAQSMTVRWEPGIEGDRVSWNVDGDCVSTITRGGESDPAGTLTIDPVQLYSSNDETCTATLELVRSHTGTVDPAFINAGLDTMWGEWKTELTFTSTP